jgi:hypothetical protein
MKYTVGLEYSFMVNDKDYITVIADTKEEAMIKAKEKLKKSVNEEGYQTLVDAFIISIEDHTENYYLVKIELSNKEVISFPWRVIGERVNIDERIQKRVEKQVNLYNSIYNTKETAVNVNKRLLKDGEFNLYDLSVE